MTDMIKVVNSAGKIIEVDVSAFNSALAMQRNAVTFDPTRQTPEQQCANDAAMRKANQIIANLDQS